MKQTGTASLLLLTVLAALTAAGNVHNAFARNKETILRLHGSNTIGAKLAPDLASAFLKKLGAASVRQTDITPGIETDIEGDFPDTNQTKVIEIRAHGSSTAFKDLKDGQCDIGMSSRKIKVDEVKSLAFLGDMTGSACEHVLALDGVAVIVNAANPLMWKMDFAVLADVFSGTITNWSQLGGTDAPIVIHARDEKSGTHDTFQSLVLGKKALAASSVRHESNEALSDAVTADVNAIGYCGMPFIRNNKALAISDGGRAVPPTVFTVSGEEYPISRRLHLYAAAASGNPYLSDFIAFGLGKEGQGHVRERNFVDLTISPRDSGTRLQGSRLNRAEGTRRLSASFRFKGESLELDSRGLRDVERLAEFLGESSKESEIILAGFSDSKGEGKGYAQSLELSCKRAQTVREKLLAQGIKVADVLCVGQEAPVASNETEQGRAKNRRVEVWVR